MSVTLPEGVFLPNSVSFGKQYLNTKIFRQDQSDLFFLLLKAKELVDQELLAARTELTVGDDVSLMQVDYQEVDNYNYFWLEHDVKKAAFATASTTVLAAAQVSGGLPIDFVLTVSDRTLFPPESNLYNDATRVAYKVINWTGTPNQMTLRAILGGTYTNTGNFPATFTNATTSSDITSTNRLISLASSVAHGASSAVVYNPTSPTVRQSRVMTTYEKYGKTLQGLIAQGADLTSTTSFDSRMSQFVYDMLGRVERSILFSQGDFQTIGSGQYYFMDGLVRNLGTTVAASALDGAPTTPTIDALDDIIERIAPFGGNYVLCVPKRMRRFIQKILRSTTNFRVNKSESDRSIGYEKWVEVVGTWGRVPIVYYPQMDNSVEMSQSIFAINLDNIFLTTVGGEKAQQYYQDLNIEGDKIIKFKRNLQNNEELNKYDGAIVDIGAAFCHRTTHFWFNAFTGV
jgi:hypothetical protein